MKIEPIQFEFIALADTQLISTYNQLYLFVFFPADSSVFLFRGYFFFYQLLQHVDKKNTIEFNYYGN